jgi:hypothetical protein
MSIVPLKNLIPNNFYILLVSETKYLIKVVTIDDIILKLYFIFLKLNEKIRVQHFKSFPSASIIASLRIENMIDYKFFKINTAQNHE